MLNNCKTAIILAGGKSQRMGYDKININYKGGRLLDYQISILKNLFEEIIVVSNQLTHYDDIQVKVVSDELKDFGPLAGVHVGLKHASSPYAYVIACDMPFIDTGFIKRMDELLNELNEEVLVATVDGYIEPFNAIYHRSLYKKIEAYEYGVGLKDLIKDSKHALINQDILNAFDSKMFSNLNTPSDVKRHLETNDTSREKTVIEITRVKYNQSSIEKDLVICEYPLTIYINQEEFITILCTPKNLIELTYGLLYSEGFINHKDDIKEINLNEKSGSCWVTLDKNIDFIKKLNGKRVRTTGCGKGSIFYHTIDSVKSHKITSNLTISHLNILKLSKELNNKSELFLETGGVHTTMLADREQVIVYYEDVGRHNTVDKIIGYALLNELQLNETVLFTSGRISSEMLLKTLKAHIPMIISRSAPTDLAVQIARDYDLSLIGFVRGERMNIYHDVNRIVIDQ